MKKSSVYSSCIFSIILTLFLCVPQARADITSASAALKIKDYPKALQYCQQDAEKGDKNCQSVLGYLYRFGLGVEKDLVVAADWYGRSAHQGNIQAQEALGTLYRLGQGVRVDYLESYRLLKLAADKGNASAMNGLGNLYRLGQGMAPDAKQAFAYYLQGAEKGHAWAQTNLAEMYLAGAGVKKDSESALLWAKKSSAQKNAGGLNVLGVMTRDGIGSNKDPKEAVRLFKLAIEAKEDPRAYGNLAELLLNGIGIAADVNQAKKWALIGAAENNAVSLKVLEKIAELEKKNNPQIERFQTEARQRDAELAELRLRLANAEKSGQSQSQEVVYAHRRALVIGNDSYQSVTKLFNAREDAKAIADSLKKFGYQVTLKFDLTEKEMKGVLRTFKGQVEGGDEVVIFYAGHGLQLGAANYLLPIDIVGESEEQIKDEGIQLQRILDDLTEKKAKFSLAMIDACRDNPFKTSGRSLGGRGLAPTTAATGQMIIFSAGAGQQALDKLGTNDKDKNGLFTRLFLKEMAKPGVSVDRILRTVRTEVARQAKTVGHEQTPALYDQSLGDFYFKQ